MKTRLLLALAMCISWTTWAQDYNYRDLQLPDVQRHALRANFSPSFQLESGNFSGSLPVNGRMDGYINNRRDQFFYSTSAGLQLAGSRSGSENSANSFSPNYSASVNYYKYNQNYFFVRPNFSTNLAFNQSNSNSPQNQFKSAGSNTNFNMGMAIGKGRIDPIDWAVRAGFMNKALNKAGAVSRNLTEEEWIVLAKAMAEVDRRRFYEFRFFNINRVKMVDSVFQDFGIITDNAAFFTTVVDQYFFAPNQALRTGSRFQVFANYTDSRSFLSTENLVDNFVETRENKNLQDRVAVGLAFDYSRPSNLHLHHNLGISTSYNTPSAYEYEERNGAILLEGNYLVPDYALASINYQLLLIPSTRTSIAWNVRNAARYSERTFSNDVSTSLNINYFVSRRFEYSLNLGLSQEEGLSFSSGFAYQVW